MWGKRNVEKCFKGWGCSGGICTHDLGISKILGYSFGKVAFYICLQVKLQNI